MKKNIFLGLMSLCLALVLGEVVLRIAGVDKVKFQEKPRVY